MAYTFCTDDEVAILLGEYHYFRESIAGYEQQLDLPRMERFYVDFLERFRTSGQAWGAAYILYLLGAIALSNENLTEAESYYRQSQDDFLQLGDRWASAWPSMGLAFIFELSERYDESHQQWQAHQDTCAAVGDRGAAVFAPAQRARVAWKQNDYHAARWYIVQGIKVHLESGSAISCLDEVLRSLIAVFMSEGSYERAADLSSFVRQQADNALAPQLVAEAHQILVSLAQKLSPALYQEAVERGKKLQLRTVLEQLLDELTSYSPSQPNAAQLDVLTERELEVLRLVAAGHSNRQIAAELFLTLNTVKSHIHHIYGKLGSASRIQAVARARELQLL
jgi:ATP/maltotriose-dependent transcriptional regulator MalT